MEKERETCTEEVEGEKEEEENSDLRVCLSEDVYKVCVVVICLYVCIPS